MQERNRTAARAALGTLVALALTWSLAGCSGAEPTQAAATGTTTTSAQQSSDAPTADPTSTEEASAPTTTAVPSVTASLAVPTPGATPTRELATAAPSPSLAPAPIATPTQTYAGVQVSLERVDAVTGEAQGPGELAGPALRVTVVVRNDSPTALPLGSALVNLFYGSGQSPAAPLSGPGVAPFPASAGAGQTVRGTYVFRVPAEGRSDVAIEVFTGSSAPVFVFRGPVS